MDFDVLDCGFGSVLADLEHQEGLQTCLGCGAGVKICFLWIIQLGGCREGQRGGSVPKQTGKWPWGEQRRQKNTWICHQFLLLIVTSTPMSPKAGKFPCQKCQHPKSVFQSMNSWAQKSSEWLISGHPENNFPKLPTNCCSLSPAPQSCIWAAWQHFCQKIPSNSAQVSLEVSPSITGSRWITHWVSVIRLCLPPCDGDYYSSAKMGFIKLKIRHMKLSFK